jgi:hypothetical protein
MIRTSSVRPWVVSSVAFATACQGHVAKTKNVEPSKPEAAPRVASLQAAPQTPVEPAQKLQLQSPLPVVVTGEGTAPQPSFDACKRASFFDFYRNARLITVDTPELVRLQIHIDYHTGAGCIAPDANGTDLLVELHLRNADGGCFIDSSEVRAVDWGPNNRGETDADDRKLRFDFTPFDVLQRADVTRADTRAVALHHPKHAVSLLVRRGGVLWYEGTNATSVLHTEVDSQGEKSGCCWPATSTHYREFGVYD